MGFDQSSEVFVPMAMARGHRRADIEVVIGYQPVWWVYPTVSITGAPCREVNSKVATAPNTQSRR